MGGTIPTARTTTTTPDQENGPPGMQPGMGSTIFLEFNKAVPDLTPDELKLPHRIAPIEIQGSRPGIRGCWGLHQVPAISRSVGIFTQKVCGLFREQGIGNDEGGRES
jgi:hypothetical protein